MKPGRLASVAVLHVLPRINDKTWCNLRPTNKREFIERISSHIIPEPADAKNPKKAT